MKRVTANVASVSNSIRPSRKFLLFSRLSAFHHDHPHQQQKTNQALFFLFASISFKLRKEESDSYFLNELDETTTNIGNSSSLLLHPFHSARYSIQSDSYFSKLSFPSDQAKSADPEYRKQRSASLNNSVKSVFQETTSTKPVLSKAVVIKEFTPSPYDKNSLSLKVSEIFLQVRSPFMRFPSYRAFFSLDW